MKAIKKSAASLMLAACILAGLFTGAYAQVSDSALSQAVRETAGYVCKTVKSPQVGSTGGEWAVLGLARSGYAVPDEYYQAYYTALEDYVKACKGKLHDRKYSEYSRVILALSSIGIDARNVAGYDLTKPLGDYEKTIWQGVNGPIWALIALDSRDYPMPNNPDAETQATRQMYVDRILDCQLSDGGWSLRGGGSTGEKDGESDPDITGMALQALAKYSEQPAVKEAIDAALNCLSEKQDAQGGFSSWGKSNSESCVQVIVALCELGIFIDDPRFVKNGNSLLDSLMSYRVKGEGFRHDEEGADSNQMASEQGLCALVAVQRAQEGKNSLYRMGDAAAVNGGSAAGAGLVNKHADVKPCPVTQAGKTFSDISGKRPHADRAAIEALAARGIIGGMDDGLFHPDESMSRAQFAAIVVRALGLTPRASEGFSDVPAGEWYAVYVGTASKYGIITGVGNDKFNPSGTITKQEAAVMVARAAKLCGMDTALDAAEVRDVLAQFSDYIQMPEWARGELAFCYSEGILDDSGTAIDGSAVVKRCEIAHMLFVLLENARLL